MIISILKRDGTVQPFEPAKINGWGTWAAESLGGLVDWTDVVMETVREVPDVISSRDLQNALIKVCLNKDSWSYNRMAGRLYAAQLHKDLYGKGDMPSIRDVHTTLQEAGFMVELDYSDDDYAKIEKFIKHKRDFTYAHFQLHHIRFKYALRNRVNKTEMESPQFVFMRMAMALAEKRPAKTRLIDVQAFYDLLSRNIINAPTPNYVNLGTHHNGLASCCLITNYDTAVSIGIADHIAYTMTYMSAGIGSNLQTRSLGDPVRGGLIAHQGKYFYLDRLKGSIRANLQNGRGGACTVYYSGFDPEVDMLARLKNPMTPATRQIRGMDYNMVGNKFLGRKAARNEDVFTFNVHTAPDLTNAFYSGDLTKFEGLYAKYEADDKFKKNYVSAREIVLTVQNEAYETGRAYLSFADEINRHTPYKDPIYSSNLCVAPETTLLTNQGHVTIESLAGQKATIWNGEEWSEVDVVKTGENQELWNVAISDGREVSVTPYHKWYVVRDYSGKTEEVRTHELEVGDKLIKFDAPVIEGTESFGRAYLNGFFTGDGCQMLGNSQRIDLFGVKRLLKDHFGEELKWNDNELKSHAYTTGLQVKYTVPGVNYLLKDRLDWLAGWLDADGSIARNGANESLVGSSSKCNFLLSIQAMLQTMGVNAKISRVRNAGLRKMPANDGSGLSKDYWCGDTYRLLITSGATQDLLALGLNLKRLKVQVRQTQRRAEQFTVVTSIVNDGRIDDTYCVTEPKRHMAVFNGILTGQCAEIVEPTRGYEAMDDLYSREDVGHNAFITEAGKEVMMKASDGVLLSTGVWGSGLDLLPGVSYHDKAGKLQTVKETLSFKHEREVALCSLAGLVVSNIKSDEEYEKAMYYALLMIDVCIHKSHYELPHVGHTAKSRMAAAVGMMDLAHYLARKKLKFSSKEGKEEIHRVAERHMYFAIKASLQLGKELGNAPWIHRTKYADGWLPIDTYQKAVDRVVQVPLQYDWEALRAEVKANGGIRNSSLVAYMPGESSSKASGTVNSIYPARELTMMKTDGNLTTYWAAPNSEKLGRFYELAWDIAPRDMIEVYAIFQKFTDQAISADLYRKIEGSEKITTEEMLEDYFHMLRLGMKTRYYLNTHTAKAVVLQDNSAAPFAMAPAAANDAASAIDDEVGCAGGGCTL